jgi:hypothetical protein
MKAVSSYSVIRATRKLLTTDATCIKVPQLLMYGTRMQPPEALAIDIPAVVTCHIVGAFISSAIPCVDLAPVTYAM